MKKITNQVKKKGYVRKCNENRNSPAIMKRKAKKSKKSLSVQLTKIGILIIQTAPTVMFNKSPIHKAWVRMKNPHNWKEMRMILNLVQCLKTNLMILQRTKGKQRRNLLKTLMIRPWKMWYYQKSKLMSYLFNILEMFNNPVQEIRLHNQRKKLKPLK